MVRVNMFLQNKPKNGQDKSRDGHFTSARIYALHITV
jgi:hypothetical protein